jgi:hypothetical protein
MLYHPSCGYTHTPRMTIDMYRWMSYISIDIPLPIKMAEEVLEIDYRIPSWQAVLVCLNGVPEISKWPLGVADVVAGYTEESYHLFTPMNGVFTIVTREVPSRSYTQYTTKVHKILHVIRMNYTVDQIAFHRRAVDIVLSDAFVNDGIQVSASTDLYRMPRRSGKTEAIITLAVALWFTCPDISIQIFVGGEWQKEKTQSRILELFNRLHRRSDVNCDSWSSILVLCYKESFWCDYGTRRVIQFVDDAELFPVLKL